MSLFSSFTLTQRSAIEDQLETPTADNFSAWLVAAAHEAFERADWEYAAKKRLRQPRPAAQGWPARPAAQAQGQAQAQPAVQGQWQDWQGTWTWQTGSWTWTAS